jgi:hypothetical protein
MFAMNLVDVTERDENYGILFCDNEKITENMIQREIYQIKAQMEENGIDWVIDDVIKNIPAEWKVYLQRDEKRVSI